MQNNQKTSKKPYSSVHSHEVSEWIDAQARILGVRPSLFIQLKMRELQLADKAKQDKKANVE